MNQEQEAIPGIPIRLTGVPTRPRLFEGVYSTVTPLISVKLGDALLPEIQGQLPAEDEITTSWVNVSIMLNRLAFCLDSERRFPLETLASRQLEQIAFFEGVDYQQTGWTARSWAIYTFFTLCLSLRRKVYVDGKVWTLVDHQCCEPMSLTLSSAEGETMKRSLSWETLKSEGGKIFPELPSWQYFSCFN